MLFIQSINGGDEAFLITTANEIISTMCSEKGMSNKTT